MFLLSEVGCTNEDRKRAIEKEERTVTRWKKTKSAGEKNVTYRVLTITLNIRCVRVVVEIFLTSSKSISFMFFMTI